MMSSEEKVFSDERSTDQKLADMKLAIATSRSSMNDAFIEDENVRLSSEIRSNDYLLSNKEVDNRIPSWVWNFLWFLLGVFFALTSPPGFSSMIMFFKNGGV